jgi:hypothetical protein
MQAHTAAAGQLNMKIMVEHPRRTAGVGEIPLKFNGTSTRALASARTAKRDGIFDKLAEVYRALASRGDLNEFKRLSAAFHKNKNRKTKED